MCGIWAIIQQQCISTAQNRLYYDDFLKIKHRGPDYSSFNIINQHTILGFHRLAINDISPSGNQPFCGTLNETGLEQEQAHFYYICNGEIYDSHGFSVQTSKSDCAIIGEMIKSAIPYNKMMNLLGSEFAIIIIIIDKNGIKLIAGRDPVGVRPLFYSINKNVENENSTLCLSSEIKGLESFDNVSVFPPAHYMIYELDNTDKSSIVITQYYFYIYKEISANFESITNNIKDILTKAVKKRLMSDAPVGCLLSGGLDSSLICGILVDLIKHDENKLVEFFTIGFKSGSDDVPFAVRVVDYLKLKHKNIKHHICYIDEEEAISNIEETIYVTESYDITTIRASAMQFMLAKYIKKHSNVKSLLVGELSDELFSGYLYNLKAPSHKECRDDAIRLVKNVHMFDGLRTDRTMSYNSLEVRLPFADIDLINYVFSLPASATSPKNNVEKAILRDSFKDCCVLPDDVLYRTKNAFSDAVSKNDKSWYKIIQDYLAKNGKTEAEFYKSKFIELFGENKLNVIPYMWMPMWSPETNDPSARTLKL